MKQFFYTLFFLIPLISFSQHEKWENKLIHSGKCKVLAVTKDPSGNTLITGSFTGSMTFYDKNFNSFGAKDIFTAKYTAKGNLLWAKQAGGSNDDESFAVTCDKNGNVYLTGYFSGFFNIDNIALDATESEKNCFVIKYDKDGFIQWGMRSFGVADKYGKAITTDQEGNVLFTGVFTKEMIFETEDPNEQCEVHSEDEKEGKVLKSKSPSNIFIAKTNANGELLWLQQSNGKGNNEASMIETDRESNCYIKGTFSQRCVFGNKKIKSKNKSSFITKYDTTGNVIWAKESTDLPGGSNHSTGVKE